MPQLHRPPYLGLLPEISPSAHSLEASATWFVTHWKSGVFAKDRCLLCISSVATPVTLQEGQQKEPERTVVPSGHWLRAYLFWVFTLWPARA